MNLQPAVASARDGIFLDACCPHCQSIATFGAVSTWTDFKIGAVSPSDAFAAWLSGGAAAPGAKNVDGAPYPSNPSCVGVGGGDPLGVGGES